MKTARTVDLPNHGNTKVSSVRQEGAKGNGNDSHVYVNDRSRVPHAFRIARIPIPSGGGHEVSFPTRILRAVLFLLAIGPLLVPVLWRINALPPVGSSSPGLQAEDRKAPENVSAASPRARMGSVR